MTKVYENPQARIGSIISGEFLKEMIERKFFPVESALIDGSFVEPGDLDSEEIDDKEWFVVAINTNCNEVMFVQLYTEHKISINTGLKAD